jgi:ferredoxin
MMIEIFILGQSYKVPESLTILKAFEFSGFRIIRGVGCRGGFCGACGTVYRMQDDHRLYYALACQTVVKPGMVLSQIPFFPARRPAYRLEELTPTGDTLLNLYPEVLRCYGCNTCTKACPQGIEVLDYVSAIVRGDLATAASISFDCIGCGLCVARCPGELIPPNMALLARRLYGKYLAPNAAHLQARKMEIEAGGCRSDIDELKSASIDDLKSRYAARQIEV